MKKIGEVWKVGGRKGPLTVKLLENVDETVDGFFEAEIVDGKVRFVSLENNLLQEWEGKGTQGDIQSFRTSLTPFFSQVKEETLKEIRFRHKKELEKFTNNCPHVKISNWMASIDAPSHYGPQVKICERCYKIMETECSVGSFIEGIKI